MTRLGVIIIKTSLIKISQEDKYSVFIALVVGLMIIAMFAVPILIAGAEPRTPTQYGRLK